MKRPAAHGLGFGSALPALLCLVACDSGSPPPAPSPHETPNSTQGATRASSTTLQADEAIVIKVLAKQLGVKVSDLQPETKLATLSMDDLDVVEVVMELEDEFKISIPDDRIAGSKSAKPGAAISIVPGLTVHELTVIVRDCRDQATTKPKSIQQP